MSDEARSYIETAAANDLDVQSRRHSKRLLKHIKDHGVNHLSIAVVLACANAANAFLDEIKEEDINKLELFVAARQKSWWQVWK